MDIRKVKKTDVRCACCIFIHPYHTVHNTINIMYGVAQWGWVLCEWEEEESLCDVRGALQTLHTRAVNEPSAMNLRLCNE